MNPCRDDVLFNTYVATSARCVVTQSGTLQRHARPERSRRGNFRIEQDGACCSIRNVPSVSKRCTLDLPGFKNLEGLYIAYFSPNNSPQTLVYNDERVAWKREW